MKGKCVLWGGNSCPEQTRRSRRDHGETFIAPSLQTSHNFIKEALFSEVVAINPNFMNYGAFPCPCLFPPRAKHQRLPTGKLAPRGFQRKFEGYMYVGGAGEMEEKLRNRETETGTAKLPIPTVKKQPFRADADQPGESGAVSDPRNRPEPFQREEAGLNQPFRRERRCARASVAKQVALRHAPTRLLPGLPGPEPNERTRRSVPAALTSLVKSGTPRCQRWSFSRPLYTTFPKTAMLPDLHSVFPAGTHQRHQSGGIKDGSTSVQETLVFTTLVGKLEF